jgi:Mg2+ and Co2+ transporter CorA
MSNNEEQNSNNRQSIRRESDRALLEALVNLEHKVDEIANNGPGYRVEPTASTLKLSLKEVCVIIVFLSSVAVAIAGVYSKLEKGELENQMKYTMLDAKVTEMQRSISKIEASQERLNSLLTAYASDFNSNNNKRERQ